MTLGSAALIDLVVTSAEMEHGRRIDRAPAGIAALGQLTVRDQKAKAPTWTLEEEDFLRSALGHLPEEVIAARLGRTLVGVRIHWKRDMRLRAPSKAHDVVTAQGAARMLGVDSHKTAGWVDVGLIPGRLMPGLRKIRLIDREQFFRWAIDPQHWVYFEPRKVQDPKLRRMIQLRMKRWGDEWWTASQVARHHRVHTSDVKRYIQLRRLQAYRPPVSRSGRHPRRYWGLWFILRSEATRPGFSFRRHGQDLSTLTPRGKRWLKKALKMGMYCSEIARTMQVSSATVHNWTHRHFPELMPASGGKKKKGRVNHGNSS